jgi:DNA uptake protein ComE-like DNA-binding protein
MTHNRQLAVFAALVVLILLVGCSPATQSAATLAPTAVDRVVATSTPSTQTESATPTQETVDGAASSQTVAATCVKLNLNDVTGEALLATIPNFSNRMVREFQEYRPYVSIQQFRREIGKYVEANQVAEYEQYVYVPVVPNDADADTLMQLPGVDDAIAATLIAGRPYVSSQAFLQALGTVVDRQQLADASCYLAAST